MVGPRGIINASSQNQTSICILGTCNLIHFDNFIFCDFHPTHSGPCCEVPDGQGPCSSSEMQAKGQKVEENTSEVLRFEMKLLKDFEGT